jgi:hypothetical protein
MRDVLMRDAHPHLRLFSEKHLIATKWGDMKMPVHLALAAAKRRSEALKIYR